jgi:hypothetical protein
MSSGWSKLGTVKAADLVAARENAHWATQILAAAADTHREHVPDTSHTSLVWLSEIGALATGELGASSGTRLALRVADLTLLVLDDAQATAAEAKLAGRTLAEASEEAARMLGGVSPNEFGAPLVRPEYEMPDHPIGTGAAFEADPAALLELAKWIGNADLVLRALAAATEDASPAVTWPHHFDLATLIEVESDAAGLATQTIGIGCSPGDEGAPAPYYYVNFWPGRETAAPSGVEGGQWNTAGWTGAILHADELVAADAQQDKLERFLRSAVAANRRLLADA